ncbi:hypothetical protein EV193_104541 [Herbihabitans rhizosphaerae]|uniref:Uncharacterized protein n=1 Tax=Herbihabitans rhizosphaerae TaxID=1872711 RepID=A0A4Q7KRZ7_9PSEU|nr:hypothetical protein [Herbihabitans rhizosphaerae]RZS39324.1 hypothetical protein EV193_104541 [Herbihabitans rhizosphaerae]
MSYFVGPNVVNTSTYVELPEKIEIDWEVYDAGCSAFVRLGGTYGLELIVPLGCIDTLVNTLTEAKAAIKAG